MITRIFKSDNEVVIEYDNRTPITIVTDNGSAWHLAETILSPHPKLTYSEWLGIQDMADDDTDVAA